MKKRRPGGLRFNVFKHKGGHAPSGSVAPIAQSERPRSTAWPFIAACFARCGRLVLWFGASLSWLIICLIASHGGKMRNDDAIFAALRDWYKGQLASLVFRCVIWRKKV